VRENLYTVFHSQKQREGHYRINTTRVTSSESRLFVHPRKRFRSQMWPINQGLQKGQYLLIPVKLKFVLCTVCTLSENYIIDLWSSS
jgi:hypothetical protein